MTEAEFVPEESAGELGGELAETTPSAAPFDPADLDPADLGAEEGEDGLRRNSREWARPSLGKLTEPLEVPDLLALQLESFDWLIGGDMWLTKREAYLENPVGVPVPMRSGLEEVFTEISPIEDIGEKMQLSFSNPTLEPEKNTIAECRERNKTYSAPLYVEAEFMNHETGEIKTQTVFMGDFPMMTEKGTFVINGTERVIVSQMMRSPGIYFERQPERNSDKDIYIGRIIPQRGAWLEFEIDRSDVLGVRIDRKRRQPVALFLKAIGMTSEEINSHFAQFPSVVQQLDKFGSYTQEESLKELYRRVRPGEQPTADLARSLLQTFYFTPRRFDLSEVGRYKINRKLSLGVPATQRLLTMDDIVNTISYLAALHQGGKEFTFRRSEGDIVLPLAYDDIDHFGNRRIRPVGELVQNQIRAGLLRMERTVRERMTTQDVETITPQTLINVRPVVTALKEFYGSSQLSQFMDQNNPLSGLTHKRRLSALGPGGLSRERAGVEVRDVHPSHFGRMCPIETPEGPNIGLIGSLACYARVNGYGFIETPYRRVENGRVTEHIDYVSADVEDQQVVAQATTPVDDEGYFVDDYVLARKAGGEVEMVPADQVTYMHMSSRQMVSVATSLIPFLEHNDANRALMGANMQRQAVPLLVSESPLVGTGMEKYAAIDAGEVVVAVGAGVISQVSADLVTVMEDDGNYRDYYLNKFVRSNQGNCYNQRVIVGAGDRVEIGDVIADGPCSDQGELSLGRNLLVAFMPWEGHNYEDAIIINQDLVKNDVLTSIHIEEHEVSARDTKLGKEEITRDLPNVSTEYVKDLDERGVIRVGAEVRPGDILVGKVSPKGETELSAEERLLRAIFNEKSMEVRDTSLKVPHGQQGTVIDVKFFDSAQGDELPAGVNQRVVVYIAHKRKITEGDKLAGRHGNKGVIAKTLPVEDMPFLADGTPVDIILNPMGIPARMNFGQVLEAHLGWLAKQGWKVEGSPEWADRLKVRELEPNTPVSTPVFDGATEAEITGLFSAAIPNRDGERMMAETGKTVLYDGRSGEAYPDPISVGYMYILKLHHLVDDKIHARSTGPYSMITQQPLGGKAQFGGQRFGEMEVWALEAYGAAHALQELLTIKSDDVLGRVRVYDAIVKGYPIPVPGIPESFKVLMKEMQSLCLNVEVIADDGSQVSLGEGRDEAWRIAENLGLNLSTRFEASSVEER